MTFAEMVVSPIDPGSVAEATHYKGPGADRPGVARQVLSHTPSAKANLQLMGLILDELSASLPDSQETVRVIVRLVAALIAGGVIGLQREASGKAAGLRTHMLVCAGTALFVVAVLNIGMEQDAVSRVIQGLATGIGFLGAGAILKVESSLEIKGLTTAAGIWMTAALGVTIGVGQLGTAAIGTALAWCVLAILIKLDRRIEGSSADRA